MSHLQRGGGVESIEFWIIRVSRWFFGVLIVWRVIRIVFAPNPWGAAWREVTVSLLEWCVIAVLALIVAVVLPFLMWGWEIKEHGWETAKTDFPTPAREWTYWRQVWAHLTQHPDEPE